MPWDVDDLPKSVANKEWTHAQKQKFCDMANAMLEKGLPESECIATATKRVEERSNALDWPKFYYARHMRAGLAKGGGTDPDEVIKVDLPAIKKMVPTGPGKPVYIQHSDVDFETMKEDCCGYITESFLESDGWAWFKIMITDDEAHNVIRKGWSVSNAYLPTEIGDGGTMHNCDYDTEILDAEFTHLALVPNPRYEEALIMSPDEFKIYRDGQRKQLEELKNAKEQKPMLKFFKMKKTEVKNSDDLTEDSYIVLDGRKITMKELISNAKKYHGKMNSEEGDEDEADKETKKEEAEDSKDRKEKRYSKKNDDKDDEDAKDKAEKENDGDMFDVDGEDVSLNALKKAYKMSKKNTKKNKVERTKGDEEDDGDDGDAEDEAEDYEEEKANKKKEKKNSHFDDLRNANEIKNSEIVIETSMDQLARGQKRYGSAS